MDNIEFAILSRLDALSRRYNIKPTDYVATIVTSFEMEGTGLRFVVPAETDACQEAKVQRMFAAIGVNSDGILKGSEIAVIDTLDSALRTAPKGHSRP